MSRGKLVLIVLALDLAAWALLGALAVLVATRFIS